MMLGSEHLGVREATPLDGCPRAGWPSGHLDDLRTAPPRRRVGGRSATPKTPHGHLCGPARISVARRRCGVTRCCTEAGVRSAYGHDLGWFEARSRPLHCRTNGGLLARGARPARGRAGGRRAWRTPGGMSGTGRVGPGAKQRTGGSVSGRSPRSVSASRTSFPLLVGDHAPMCRGRPEIIDASFAERVLLCSRSVVVR